MNSPQNFRSAFNGFNREDVVNYISFISNKHESLVVGLRSELEELRAQLALRQEADNGDFHALEQQIETLSQERSAAEELLTELNRDLDSLNARNATLQSDVAEKDAEITALKEALAQKDALLNEAQAELNALKSAPTQSVRSENSLAEELNAYRRAERTERRARERVNQMFDQVNGTLAEASVRAEQTAAQVAELTRKAEEDLTLLADAIAGSKGTLAEVAALLASVRPELDEN